MSPFIQCLANSAIAMERRAFHAARYALMHEGQTAECKPEMIDNPEHDHLGNMLPQPSILEDRTGYVPLYGVVSKGLGPLGKYYGFTEITDFTRAVEAFTEDSRVERLALDIASPGGTVLGTREAAEAVADAARVKPVLCYTDHMLASAAYYIGAASSYLYVSPSSIVGSIGVYSYILDDSAAWENEGCVWIVFRSGAMKGVGLDRVNEEQKAVLQSEVDRLGVEFRDWVSQHMPEVSAEDMDGRTYNGQVAVQRGFAHATARSFNEALSRFTELTN